MFLTHKVFTISDVQLDWEFAGFPHFSGKINRTVFSHSILMGWLFEIPPNQGCVSPTPTSCFAPWRHEWIHPRIQTFLSPEIALLGHFWSFPNIEHLSSTFEQKHPKVFDRCSFLKCQLFYIKNIAGAWTLASKTILGISIQNEA